jgi:hypothetical protein
MGKKETIYGKKPVPAETERVYVRLTAYKKTTAKSIGGKGFTVYGKYEEVLKVVESALAEHFGGEQQ